jgi:hypothetical protein
MRTATYSLELPKTTPSRLDLALKAAEEEELFATNDINELMKSLTE